MLSIKVGILCAKQKFAKAAMQLLGHVEVVQGHVSVDDCLLLHHRLSFRQKCNDKNFTQNDFLFIDKGFQMKFIII